MLQIPDWDQAIGLGDLTGLHLLSGVDYFEEDVLNHYGGDEACQVIRFVVNGVTYIAFENRLDGYRSCMEGCYKSTTPITNSFEPIQVLGSLIGEELIEFRDCANGKVVLSIGTNYDNSYYPCFVADWTPENLTVNRKD